MYLLRRRVLETSSLFQLPRDTWQVTLWPQKLAAPTIFLNFKMVLSSKSHYTNSLPSIFHKQTFFPICFGKKKRKEKKTTKNSGLNLNIFQKVVLVYTTALCKGCACQQLREKKQTSKQQMGKRTAEVCLALETALITNYEYHFGQTVTKILL